MSRENMLPRRAEFCIISCYLSMAIYYGAGVLHMTYVMVSSGIFFVAVK